MIIRDKNVGFALTGSHCTYEKYETQVTRLVDTGVNVYPIVSYTVANTNTRFGRGKKLLLSLKPLQDER